jgi:hypothetical protein
MMFFQQLPSQPQRRYPIHFLLLLLIAAVVVWILSTIHLLQETWATMLNAIFTGLGTIFALLQWHIQAAPLSPDIPVSLTPEKQILPKAFARALTKKREGAVVVYASRKWRGTTLYLVPGLQGTTESIEAVSNVVEQWVAGQRRFCCHFPAVPPGHYTLVALTKRRRVHVTVYPKHTSEVDWR